MTSGQRARSKDVRLDFRSGGWVILLSLLILAALVALRVVPSIRHGRTPYGAPLADLPYNGFDVSVCLVPAKQLVAGMPRDTLLPLDEPQTVPAGQIEAVNRRYRKYLLAGDRVVGVVVAGQARAYPLRVLDWHEICNDTLGGEPIAVTYSPLCDSAVVFDRAVDGRTRRFAVSGLLHNSNLVMYDVPGEPAQGADVSLWSQLQCRAIAGPAAREGTRLRTLPAQVVYWDDWRAAHPETTVVAPDPACIDRYNRNPYSSYYGRGEPRYPVEPLPADATLPLFAPVIAVETPGGRCVFPFSTIAARAGANGQWTTRCAGTAVRFDYRRMPPNPATVWVRADSGAVPVRSFQGFWFAWHAMHPRDLPAEAGRDEGR